MQHDIQIANTASNLMLCNEWYCGLRSNHIESCIGTSIWPTKQNDCIQNLKHNNITDEVMRTRSILTYVYFIYFHLHDEVMS